METYDIELTNPELCSLTATIATCILINLERHLPPHAKLARLVKDAEGSITALAQTAGVELDQRLKDVGLAAWNAAMETMKAELTK